MVEVVFQIFIDMESVNSVISLKDSNSEIEVDVSNLAESTYGDTQNLCLVNSESITLFRYFNLTFKRGEHLETSTIAHVICLLYNSLTSSKDKGGSSINFHHSGGEKSNEFRDDKVDNTGGNFYVRICSKDIFGFAERQKIVTIGLGCILTMGGNNDASVVVLALAGDANVAIVFIRVISWNKPPYTPNFPQQKLLREHFFEAPTQLSSIE